MAKKKGRPKKKALKKTGIIFLVLFLIMIGMFAFDFSYLIPNYASMLEDSGSASNMSLYLTLGVWEFITLYKFLLLIIVFGLIALCSILYTKNKIFIKILTDRWSVIFTISFIVLIILLALSIFMLVTIMANVPLFAGSIL